MPEFLGQAIRDMEEPQSTAAVPEPLPVPDDEMSADQLEQLRSQEVAFTWQASEYVQHHKSGLWYIGLLLLAGGLVGLAVALTPLAPGSAGYRGKVAPPQRRTQTSRPSGVQAIALHAVVDESMPMTRSPVMYPDEENAEAAAMLPPPVP